MSEFGRRDLARWVDQDGRMSAAIGRVPQWPSSDSAIEEQMSGASDRTLAPRPDDGPVSGQPTGEATPQAVSVDPPLPSPGTWPLTPAQQRALAWRAYELRRSRLLSPSETPDQVGEGQLGARLNAISMQAADVRNREATLRAALEARAAYMRGRLATRDGPGNGAAPWNDASEAANNFTFGLAPQISDLLAGGIDAAGNVFNGRPANVWNQWTNRAEETRGARDAFRERHPWRTFAAGAFGGLATPALGTVNIVRGGGRAAELANLALTTGAQGALTGWNDANAPGESRAAGALTGAVNGVALGAGGLPHFGASVRYLRSRAGGDVAGDLPGQRPHSFIEYWRRALSDFAGPAPPPSALRSLTRSN